ncbi:hypothetical protein DID76_00005 [Candidatus Marinamargulisbacteria bacterium SCGC AG-414-C22]|nr:hypothetical protein DID76_00005 [Candidatus Marinamargulisbacteria bacterium SCGC AG-414-C22]
MNIITFYYKKKIFDQCIFYKKQKQFETYKICHNLQLVLSKITSPGSSPLPIPPKTWTERSSTKVFMEYLNNLIECIKSNHSDKKTEMLNCIKEMANDHKPSKKNQVQFNTFLKERFGQKFYF